MQLTRLSFFYLLLIILCSACMEQVQDNGKPVITSVLDTDAFDEEDEVKYTLADGFTLDLWAPGPLLANAVSLSFDEQGVAYVTETQRRKSSDFDIRSHNDWMIEDLALQSVDDTKVFHLEKLATKLSEENTWLTDFNEDGIHDHKDLTVQSEVIRKIYDSDGDGRADASHVYADGINEMTSGVAAGVLYHQGDVFVTVAPDVYRFRDIDDDGDYDTKEIISTGYGVHIAYAGHDMSGLTVGPDGKIYWSIGDLGLNVVDQDGKRWMYPDQGAVMRCNPDGSDFQVYAHGLRNPQEISFDAYGNLITVDNDGDHPGERERYVHIIEGSDSGWRINWQYGKYTYPNEKYKVWMDEGLYLPYFKGQPAYITPPLALAADGPAGLAYNPGTALGQEWNDHFFASYFTGNSKRSKLQAFKLKPKGASFELEKEMDIINGINSTGVNFGPDGGLYINDWKASYDKKEEGRIWKLDVTNRNAARVSTASILASGPKDISLEELKPLMDHQDMRVRQMAQFELVDRGESSLLLDMIKDAKTLFGKLHAVWGYGQMMRSRSLLANHILPILNSENEHVRAQVAKVLGDAGHKDAYDELVVLLKDPSMSVQFFATEALGKIGNLAAFDKLVGQLDAIGDSDPHHRHAIIFALSKLDEGLRLAELNDHPSGDVRLGAVVALREIGSPLVASFLNDNNSLVVTEAARAINDDESIPEALVGLAESLQTSPIAEEAFVRRAINANLRIGDAKSAKRLQSYFLDTTNDESMRKDALWALGSMAEPLPLDRVDNKYREIAPGNVAAASAELATIFNSIDAYESSDIKSMIIRVAGRLSYMQAEEQLLGYVKNESESKSIRIVSMEALAALGSEKLTEAINIVIEDEDVDLRKEAQKIIGKSGFSEATKLQIIEKILNTASVQEKQAALRSLSMIKTEEAEALLSAKLIDLSNLDAGVKLDVINAAKAQESKTLDELIEKYEAAKPKDDKLAKYQESMVGGDAEKGKNIFANNESAQCLRCHQVQGYGGIVGPSLDKIGSMLSREDLVLSLVDPSARIAPGYGNVYYTMKDGREIVAMLVSEERGVLTLMDAAGKQLVIKDAEIASRENMPSGMISQESILNRSEIRDLVAFLVTLK